MWYKKDQKKIYLTIIAKPNAKKNAILRVDEQGLYISLHAKPHQGEANEELRSFLAEQLRIPKSRIDIQKGETSRYKRVELPLDAPIELLIKHLQSE